MIVFYETSRFNSTMPFYSKSKYTALSHPTLDTGEILEHLRLSLKNIYMEGLEVKRSGVILTDIIQDNNIQLNFYDPTDRAKQKRLSDSIDKIISKHGREKIKNAVQLKEQHEYFSASFLSKNPTTNFNDIITIRV